MNEQRVSRSREFWRNNILAAVGAQGATASLSNIYDWLEVNGNLTEQELSESPYGQRPWFQHTVRYNISVLVQNGDLIRVGRGRYRLLGTQQ